MRNVLRTSFPGERPDQQDVHLDSLMSADSPSPTVEPLLRALAAEPRQHELGGFDQPLAGYRSAFSSSLLPARRTWRPSMLASLLGAKLGATIAGVAVGLGGTAAAAYTGALPGGAQNLAHQTIGAPAATPSATPKPKATGQAVGPDATGPAAHGLCNAWSQHQKNGAKPTNSVAFRNLATAAGGEAKIAAYCATVSKPGNSNHPTGAPSGRPTSKSTGKATGQGHDKDKSTKDKDDKDDKDEGEGTDNPSTLPTPTSTATQR